MGRARAESWKLCDRGENWAKIRCAQDDTQGTTVQRRNTSLEIRGAVGGWRLSGISGVPGSDCLGKGIVKTEARASSDGRWDSSGEEGGKLRPEGPARVYICRESAGGGNLQAKTYARLEEKQYSRLDDEQQSSFSQGTGDRNARKQPTRPGPPSL